MPIASTVSVSEVEPGVSKKLEAGTRSPPRKMQQDFSARNKCSTQGS